MIVSTTLVIATMAPSEIRSAAQLIPAPSLSATARGASEPLSCSRGTAAVATIETAM